MHRFAKAARRYETLVRVFTDCGLRLGEVLPLRREDFDGDTLQVRRIAHEGRILEGTKPTTASPTPAASSRSRRPSPGCSKPRSSPTERTASCCSRPHVAASGASAPSAAICGSRPREASGLDIRPMSAAIAMSRTSGQRASTTPTWPRSQGIELRRCWRDTRTLWVRALLTYGVPSPQLTQGLDSPQGRVCPPWQ
jgi:hypothetical protein